MIKKLLLCLMFMLALVYTNANLASDRPKMAVKVPKSDKGLSGLSALLSKKKTPADLNDSIDEDLDEYDDFDDQESSEALEGILDTFRVFVSDMHHALDLVLMKDISYDDRLQWVSATTKKCGVELPVKTLHKMMDEVGITSEDIANVEEVRFSIPTIQKGIKFAGLRMQWSRDNMTFGQRMCVAKEMVGDIAVRMKDISASVLQAFMHLFQTGFKAIMPPQFYSELTAGEDKTIST